MTLISASEWSWQPVDNLMSTRTRKPNRLPGIRIDRERGCYIAQGFRRGKMIHLYYGKDYFEACCAKKSWDNRNPSFQKIISEETKEAIRASKLTTRKAAAFYGVSSAAVSVIRNGGWKEVEETKKRKRREG